MTKVCRNCKQFMNIYRRACGEYEIVYLYKKSAYLCKIVGEKLSDAVIQIM